MKAKTVRNDQIANCPRRSLLPDHYRDDGTCKCCGAVSNSYPCIRDEGHVGQPHRDRHGREWGQEL